METSQSYKVYGYRWVVLALYVLVGTVIQIMWATFFSISIEAGEYYGFTGSETEAVAAIDLFSIIFMVGMIVLSVPSFAAFEKFGYKKSVGFGALLMAVGAMVRGIFGADYNIVLICTILFAIAQPFILNAVGLVAGKWFPANERATANGLGLMSNYLGIMVGLILVPVLSKSGTDIPGMLLPLGIVTVVAVVIFLIFTREEPPTPPCAEDESVRLGFGKGIKDLFKKKDFVLLLLAFFLTLGVFNIFFTKIEPILKAFGGEHISTLQTGIIGVIVLIVAIVGSVVIPLLSDKDKKRRRKPYMLICSILGSIGISSMMFMNGFGSLALVAGMYGLFSIGAGPVTMTFAAEIAYPTSEGTSEGLLLLAGNIAGAVFLAAVGVFGGNYTALMTAIAVMLLVSLILMALTNESKKTQH
ncbi:MAG: MFS transporter [Clostridiales Family XIII bacterium]|jgi:MFS family permease|nr:MFS transporter [Clostridiales Family XIII bacterium]